MPEAVQTCPISDSAGVRAVKSAVETLNPTRVKLTIEVPYEELKPSLDAALKAIASQIHVPGFRPGKVPTRLVEQRVGKGAVLQEAVNDSLPQFYGQAVEEAELRPLGQPRSTSSSSLSMKAINSSSPQRSMSVLRSSFLSTRSSRSRSQLWTIPRSMRTLKSV